MKKLVFASLMTIVLAFAFAARDASACDKCPGKDGKACGCAKAEGKECGCAAKAEGKDCGCKEGKECGCGKDCQCGKAAAAPATGVAKDMIGKEATCPVSGEKFKIAETTPTSEYQGKTYYFCCSGCKPKFDKDPAKFVK